MKTKLFFHVPEAIFLTCCVTRRIVLVKGAKAIIENVAMQGDTLSSTTLKYVSCNKAFPTLMLRNSVPQNISQTTHTAPIDFSLYPVVVPSLFQNNEVHVQCHSTIFSEKSVSLKQVRFLLIQLSCSLKSLLTISIIWH